MQIALNPSPFDKALESCDLKKITYFLLNEIEGGQISGEKEPDKILDVMMSKFPEAKVVLTLGSDGVVYRDKDQTCRQGIFKVKAVDRRGRHLYRLLYRRHTGRHGRTGHPEDVRQGIRDHRIPHGRHGFHPYYG